MIELLLPAVTSPEERRDYLNGVGRDGWTALALSARGGHVAAAKALLAHGADPAVAVQNGKTALDIARLNQKEAIVALLACDDHAWR